MTDQTAKQGMGKAEGAGGSGKDQATTRDNEAAPEAAEPQDIADAAIANAPEPRRRSDDAASGSRRPPDEEE